MAWTPPRTWIPYELVTDTMLNVHVRDNLVDLNSRLAGLSAGTVNGYTPAWNTAGTQPTIGDGALVGRYWVAAGICYFSIAMITGASTTYGTGEWFLTLPPKAFDPALAVGLPVGFARILQVGFGFHIATVMVASPTQVSISPHGAGSNVGQFVPFTWAGASHQIFILGSYRVAS